MQVPGQQRGGGLLSRQKSGGPCPTLCLLSSSLTQQSPKGDGWREGSKVDENDGCQALGVQSVPEIAEVLWVTPTDIPDQTPKGAASALKGVGLGLLFLLLHPQL